MRSRLAQVRLAARLRLLLRDRARLDLVDDRTRAAWRDEQVRRLRSHAVAHSPRYRELHDGLDDAPLSALPIVTKHDILDHYDDFLTDPGLRYEHLRDAIERDERRARQRYRVAMSSGSSGRPGLLPFDGAEWLGMVANAARARLVAGHPPVDGRIRSAKIGSPSRWHLSNQVPATLADPRRPSLTLSAARSVDDLADELRRWQPHLISGYPSVLVALAALDVGSEPAIRPAQVFAGGEPLTPGGRRHIESAWGVSVFDQYVTTEAGFVAIECPFHDGLHVMDDHVVVEVVDRAGAPVRPGTAGDRVLLTVLGSRTLPLLRYEIGDSATMDTDPCACGRTSPRLRSIAPDGARTLLRLPGVGGVDIAVHPVLLTAVLDATPVRAWQVVHDGDRIRVHVVDPDPTFRPGLVEADLRRGLIEAGALRPVIEVTEVDALERSASGKAGLVISHAGDGATSPARDS